MSSVRGHGPLHCAGTVRHQERCWIRPEAQPVSCPCAGDDRAASRVLTERACLALPPREGGSPGLLLLQLLLLKVEGLLAAVTLM